MSIWRYRRLVAAAATAVSVPGLSLIPALATPAQAACTTYYISNSGSDSNSGCSASAPWASIAKVNATTFSAGNQILFQAGGSWTGELHPLGSGASGNNIVLASYGSGADPIIAGAGAAAAVYLDDQQYWTIEDLYITNTTSGAAAIRSGIQLENDTSGILNGITIRYNYVENVKGYWTDATGQPSTSAGIAFNLSDSYATNGWNNVLIHLNTLVNTDASGIYLGSVKGTGHDEYTTGVTISNNSLTNAGGNDIVCVFCNGAVVTNNLAENGGSRYSGAGIWTAISENGVIEDNEVYSQHKHGSDGQAFDIDLGTNNTTLQYNYSLDNVWGFFEFCCSADANSAENGTVRYNISQDDGTDEAVFRLFGVNTSGTSRIYNNTIYVDSSDNSAITTDNPAGDNLYLTNNIIYNTGSGGYASTSGETWAYNTFYGNHPSSEPADAHKLTSNPDFADAGGGGTSRSTATAYDLDSGSPDLGSGVLIANNGGQDFFGNSVSSTAAPNRGAY
jgi:hypothetical protein